MIRQKRSIQLELTDSNEERGQFTVGDLRNFLKKANEHKLPNTQVIEFYRDPYRFGFRGFQALWEEWNEE